MADDTMTNDEYWNQAGQALGTQFISGSLDPDTPNVLANIINVARAGFDAPTQESSYAVYQLTQLTGLSDDEVIAKIASDAGAAELAQDEKTLIQTHIALQIETMPTGVIKNGYNAARLASDANALALAYHIYDIENGPGAWDARVKSEIIEAYGDMSDAEYSARQDLLNVTAQHGAGSPELIAAADRYFENFQSGNGNREIEINVQQIRLQIQSQERIIERITNDERMTDAEKEEMISFERMQLDDAQERLAIWMPRWANGMTKPIRDHNTNYKLAETLYERMAATDEFKFNAELEYNRLAELDGRPSWAEHVAALKQPLVDNLESATNNRSERRARNALKSFDEAELLNEWADGHIEQKAYLSQFDLSVYAEYGLDAGLFDAMDFQSKRNDEDQSVLASDTDKSAAAKRFGEAWLTASAIVYDGRAGREPGDWDKRRAELEAQGATETEIYAELARDGEWGARWHDGNWVAALLTERNSSPEYQAAVSYLVKLDAYTRYEWNKLDGDLVQDIGVGAADPLTVVSMGAAVGVGIYTGGSGGVVTWNAANLARAGLVASLTGGVEGGVTERLTATSGQNSEVNLGIRDGLNQGEIDQRTMGGAVMGSAMGAGFFGGGHVLGRGGRAILNNTSIGKSISSATSNIGAKFKTTASDLFIPNRNTDAPAVGPTVEAALDLINSTSTLAIDTANAPKTTAELELPSSLTQAADDTAPIGPTVDAAANATTNANAATAEAPASAAPAAGPAPSTAGLLSSVMDMGRRLGDAVPFEMAPYNPAVVSMNPYKWFQAKLREDPKINKGDNRQFIDDTSPNKWADDLEAKLKRDPYSDAYRTNNADDIGKKDPELPFRRVRKKVKSSLDPSTDPILGAKKYRSLADFQRGLEESTMHFVSAMQSASKLTDPAAKAKAIKDATDVYNLTLDKMDAATDHLDQQWELNTTADPDKLLEQDGRILRNKTRHNYAGGYAKDKKIHIVAIQKIAVQETIVDARMLINELTDTVKKPDSEKQLETFLLGVTSRVNKSQSHDEQFDSLIASGWTYTKKQDIPKYTEGPYKGEFKIGHVSLRAKKRFGHELAEGAHAFTLGTRFSDRVKNPNIENKNSTKGEPVVRNLNNEEKYKDYDGAFQDGAEAIDDMVSSKQFSDFLYFANRGAQSIPALKKGSPTDPYRDPELLLEKLTQRWSGSPLTPYKIGILKRLHVETDKIARDNPEDQLGEWEIGAVGEEGQDIGGTDLSARGRRAIAAIEDINHDLQDGRNADLTTGGRSAAARKSFAASQTRLWLDKGRDYYIRLKDIDYKTSAEGRIEKPVGWRYKFSEDTGGWARDRKFGTLGRLYGRWLTPIEGTVMHMKALPDDAPILMGELGKYARTAQGTRMVRWGGHTLWHTGMGAGLYFAGTGAIHALNATPAGIVFQGTGALATLQDAYFDNGVSWGYASNLIDDDSSPASSSTSPTTPTTTTPVDKDRYAQALDVLGKQIKDNPASFVGVTVNARNGKITNSALVGRVTQKAAELAAADPALDILMTSNFTPYWDYALIAVKLDDAFESEGMQPPATQNLYNEVLAAMSKDSTVNLTLLNDEAALVEKFGVTQAAIKADIDAKAARFATATKGVTEWFTANSTSFKTLTPAQQAEAMAELAGQLAELQTPGGAYLTLNDYKDLDAVVVTKNQTTGALENKTLRQIYATTQTSIDARIAQLAAGGGNGATGGTTGTTGTPGTTGFLGIPNAPSAEILVSETGQSAANLLNTILDHDNNGVGAHIDTDLGRTVSGTVQSIWRAAVGAHGSMGQTPGGKQTLNGIYAFGGAMFVPWALSNLPGFSWANNRGIRPLIMIASFFLGWKALNGGMLSGGQPGSGKTTLNGQGTPENSTPKKLTPSTEDTLPRAQEASAEADAKPGLVATDASFNDDEDKGGGEETGGGAGSFVMRDLTASVDKVQHGGDLPVAMHADYSDEDLSDIEQAIADAQNNNSAELAVQSGDVNGTASRFGSEATVVALSLATNGGAHLSNAVMGSEQQQSHITAIDVHTGDVKEYDVANNAVMIGAADIAAASLAANNTPSQPQMAS